MKKSLSLLAILVCVAGFATAQTKTTKPVTKKASKMKTGAKLVKGAKKPIVINKSKKH